MRSKIIGLDEFFKFNNKKITVFNTIFDGSTDEDWALSTTKTLTQVFSVTKPSNYTSGNYLHCNQFPYNASGDVEKIAYSFPYFYIALDITKVSTVEELRTFLSENQLITIYGSTSDLAIYINGIDYVSSYISPTTGEANTSVLSYSTEYIRLDQFNGFALSGSTDGANRGIAFYDDAKTFISGSAYSSLPYSFSKPANAVYMRISYPVNTINTIKLTITS